MVQINFPKEYGYFWDILRAIKNGEKLPIDEAHIVGGRKSGKTTVVELFYALICELGIDKVGMCAWRNTILDSGELFDDFCATFDSYELNYTTKINAKKIYLNGREIRICGLNSMGKSKAKKSGLAKFGNVNYIIVFFEERFEFSEQDILAIKEAVRSIDKDSSKEVQFLYINVCNPWALNSPYISYLSKIQPWDVKQLKETGSQIGIYDIPVGNTTKKILIHYTNWRVCREYLGESEIKSLLDTWNTDPKRAATVDFGLPGYEQGAIYTHLLNNLGKAIYQEHEFLSGGVDYGWGRDSKSGKTVAVFMGYTPNEGVDVYGEYVHSNVEKVKSPDQVAKEVVLFYREQMLEYCSRNGWASPFNLTIRVENMEVAWIAMLNTCAKQLGIHWLRFVKCRKYQVQDRIEITCSLMYQHKLRLGDNVKLLKAEMELAHYEEGKETQKRKKDNDHSLNAFEYAIEPFMFKIAKENGITKVAMRLSNVREKIW